MGYCVICSEYTGFGGDYLCDECYNVKKIVAVYGIERVNKTLNSVFIRHEDAVTNRTENIDKVTRDYDLRKKKEKKNVE